MRLIWGVGGRVVVAKKSDFWYRYDMLVMGLIFLSLVNLIVLFSFFQWRLNYYGKKNRIEIKDGKYPDFLQDENLKPIYNWFSRGWLNIPEASRYAIKSLASIFGIFGILGFADVYSSDYLTSITSFLYFDLFVNLIVMAILIISLSTLIYVLIYRAIVAFDKYSSPDWYLDMFTNGTLSGEASILAFFIPTNTFGLFYKMAKHYDYISEFLDGKMKLNELKEGDTNSLSNLIKTLEEKLSKDHTLIFLPFVGVRFIDDISSFGFNLIYKYSKYWMSWLIIGIVFLTNIMSDWGFIKNIFQPYSLEQLLTMVNPILLKIISFTLVLNNYRYVLILVKNYYGFQFEEFDWSNKTRYSFTRLLVSLGKISWVEKQNLGDLVSFFSISIGMVLLKIYILYVLVESAINSYLEAVTPLDVLYLLFFNILTYYHLYILTPILKNRVN